HGRNRGTAGCKISGPRFDVELCSSAGVFAMVAGCTGRTSRSFHDDFTLGLQRLAKRGRRPLLLQREKDWIPALLGSSPTYIANLGAGIVVTRGRGRSGTGHAGRTRLAGERVNRGLLESFGLSSRQ